MENAAQGFREPHRFAQTVQQAHETAKWAGFFDEKSHLRMQELR
jgi:hypothetical protein